MWQAVAVTTSRITRWCQSRTRDEIGASLVEYALLLGLVAAVAIAGLALLGGATSNLLNNAGGG